MSRRIQSRRRHGFSSRHAADIAPKLWLPKLWLMTDDLLLFVAIGFAAQLVDGALGMAYGLSATTVLLSMGVPPATASASIHAAEVFTTGASGLAHWRFGNIDVALFRRLVLAGALGGAVGAFILANAPNEVIRPVVNAYLLLMGGVILYKALQKRHKRTGQPQHVAPLGLAGGFLDAIGGGGWGPLVTSTLIGKGVEPRLAIGSSNAAEFFIASVVSATFVFTIGLDLWPVIVGLILGGVLAAPFAAYAVRRLPDKMLMILVAAVIMVLSLRGLVQVLSAMGM